MIYSQNNEPNLQHSRLENKEDLDKSYEKPNNITCESAEEISNLNNTENSINSSTLFNKEELKPQFLENYPNIYEWCSEDDLTMKMSGQNQIPHFSQKLMIRN